MLRIVTWNCQGGFRKKTDAVLKLKPDILIIQECENPEKYIELKNIACEYHWIGDKDKGLCTFILNDQLKIELLENFNEEFKYIVPIKITGNHNLLLFSVWTKNSIKREDRYISQLFNALNYYANNLSDSLIIAGDVNWNLFFDQDSSQLKGYFSDVLKILESNKIVSSYHKFNQVEYGKEPAPTFFQYRKINKPYHIDYCFLKEEFFEIKNVVIGSFENYITYSDHMPIITDLEVK